MLCQFWPNPHNQDNQQDVRTVPGSVLIGNCQLRIRFVGLLDSPWRLDESVIYGLRVAQTVHFDGQIVWWSATMRVRRPRIAPTPSKHSFALAV